MNNQQIATIFSEISDLLEIKGVNPFKIRAYRNAAETLTTLDESVSEMDSKALLSIPSIGKDLASRIQEISRTGTSLFYTELLENYPRSLLDLLKLQGLGPKTVSLLHTSLNVTNIDDLERAIQTGQLNKLRGLGQKKQALILNAIAEHRKYLGRQLSASAWVIAKSVVDYLQSAHPNGRFHVVGSLRRGCETCGDIDILAVDASESTHDTFISFPTLERVIVKGKTKSSILLRDGSQIDLRLVPLESEGAALQYFTGSRSHNVSLRDRAIKRGLKLNEYGLFQTSDQSQIKTASEREIYRALGLSDIPPELRENRGEIQAAESNNLPSLVTRKTIRGDLHSHTTATDGQADIETMARAAQSAGLEYLGITDHSQALAMANGLDETRMLKHADAIREIDRRLPNITLLAGVECDILPDGKLDLSEDCLAQLDFVIASVHSSFKQGQRQMTDRILRAIESPVVDIVGHPTGRLLLRREPYDLEIDEVIEAAATNGVALEINSQPQRLDLNEIYAKRARDRGVKLVISTDAHAPDQFSLLDRGLFVARRAWLEPRDILNTQTITELRASLRRSGLGNTIKNQ
tara:strand:- start:6888 stop:8627 length:1740 start_codon:yes stop_codon:yes gene_type:complete